MSLEIKNITFGYSPRQTVLEDISFKVEDNEFISLAGPNGTGKTTLLKCINRILKPQTGQIVFNGSDITGWKQQAIAKIIAYVPQFSNALRSMTVINAVMMGRLPHVQGSYSAKDREIVYSILQKWILKNFLFEIFAILH